MKAIIEIVFEGVQLEKVVNLLKNTIDSSVLKGYQISTTESDIEINFQSHKSIISNIAQSSDGSFYFNFSDFSLKGLSLDVGFQILKYNNVYDLNLHFEENEISQKISALNLQKWVESVANELKTDNYYCGCEPAIDKETRFFTLNKLGPVSWSNFDK